MNTTYRVGQVDWRESSRDRERQAAISAVTSARTLRSKPTQHRSSLPRQTLQPCSKIPASARARRPLRCKREPAAKKIHAHNPRPVQSRSLTRAREGSPREAGAPTRTAPKAIPALRLVNPQTQILARRLRAGAGQSASSAGISPTRGRAFTRLGRLGCARAHHGASLRRSGSKAGRAARETGEWIFLLRAVPLTHGAG